MDDQGLHIIDNVEINDSRTTDGQGGLFPSRIIWNEIVFEASRPDTCETSTSSSACGLKHPTALRMYRFLGKRFYVGRI